MNSADRRLRQSPPQEVTGRSHGGAEGSTRWRLPVMVMALVLGVAVVGQVIGQSRLRERMSPPALTTLLPREFPGWNTVDLPVAETPELQKSVEGILHFDAALYRVYRRGDMEIGVYLSYWLPGKIPPSLVDGHVPDICWVDNGWEMKKLPPLPAQSTDRGEVAIPNCREFSLAGKSLAVAYWHIVAHRLRGQQSVAEGHLSFGQRVERRLRQILQAVIEPPGEQIFLRVSSNRPLTEGLASAPSRACAELIARSLAGEDFHDRAN